eukprot:m.190407 g.190407  ORF g.190407 m.190407 type:complete len:53 (+) comp39432_c1_seq12:718-876(+)
MIDINAGNGLSLYLFPARLVEARCSYQAAAISKNRKCVAILYTVLDVISFLA